MDLWQLVRARNVDGKSDRIARLPLANEFGQIKRVHTRYRDLQEPDATSWAGQTTMKTATGATAGERPRGYKGPAILSYGFRPFFLFGSLYAACAVAAWIGMIAEGTSPPGIFQGVAWHSHEMIFGYLAAIVAGFILTAVPNWTGRLPVTGAPLGALLLVWLAGRIAIAILPWPWITLLIDAAFLVLLSAGLWREIVAGRNWRSAPICVLISLFAAANILAHLGQSFESMAGYGDRLALGVAALLIGLIGGRVVPSFTRNWMARLGVEPKPAPFGRFDKGVLIIAALALGWWVAAPTAFTTGAMLVAGGLLHLARLARWRGDKTLREPMVAILHVGYFWLALAFVMIGSAILFPDVIGTSSSLHALSAGAIGTMTLAIMTRATLGHTGHEITANTATVAIYCLVTIGSVARVAAPYLPVDYVLAIGAGGVAWAASFLLFSLAYGPLLLRRNSLSSN